MCIEDRRITSQIKGMNLNSASNLSDSVEESSDCNSCCTEEGLLCRMCVCLYATNCGSEQSRAGEALINSEAEPSEAPNLSHHRPLTALSSCEKPAEISSNILRPSEAVQEDCPPIYPGITKT